jgi:hypothetical protein
MLLFFVALSGFGWGKKETANETKQSPVTTTVPVTTRATTTTTLPTRPAVKPSEKLISAVPPTTVPPAPSPKGLLTSGDPETRKATIERLARLRRALDQKNKPQQAQ